MIKYALRCGEGHVFDAWFANGATFDALSAAGHLTCAVCGRSDVTKAPMAPRIAKNAFARKTAEARPVPAEPASAPPATAPEPPAGLPPALVEKARRLREIATRVRAKVEAECDYVGDRFAEEARSIHLGETEERPIWGEATADQARDLVEEGISIAPVPRPPTTN